MSCYQHKIPSCNALNPHKQTVLVYNDITHDIIWTRDKNWVLMNRIHVINNSVLSIEEGTTIYANSPDYSDPRNPPSLIVTIGSKLFAEGTCECPITFTSILPNCVIFALNNKKVWTYNGGLGPFSALWSGIYVCGNNETNLTLVEESYPINLPGTSVTYGGDISNTNNVVLSHVRIYFAGDASITNSNSLTLAAPSYNCTFQNLEILYGQGDAIRVYGGNALIKDSIFGFKYQGDHISLKDGAQIALTHNIYIDGFSNIDPNYQTNGRAFVHVESVDDMETTILRNSVVNLAASTFLSLGFIPYHVYTTNGGVFKSVNNVHVGPCTCVYSVPEDVSSPYTFTTTAPTSYVPTEFYLGPIAYEQSNGTLYCGPAETFQNAYNESGQLLLKITYLTNGYNNELLTCGKFLNIAPVPTSDAYKSISTDMPNSHVLPFIPPGFYDNNSNLELALLSVKKSFHASGAVETESEQSFWCFGYFERFLTICCKKTECCCYQHEEPCCEPEPCHPTPSYSESSSSSSCSFSMEEECHENKTNDMITKGLILSNMAVMGYFLLRTLTKK